MSDKPLGCKIGLHSWFIDSALIHSAERCNYCPATRGNVEALDAERARIAALPGAPSLGDISRAALGLPPAASTPEEQTR